MTAEPAPECDRDLAASDAILRARSVRRLGQRTTDHAMRLVSLGIFTSPRGRRSQPGHSPPPSSAAPVTGSSLICRLGGRKSLCMAQENSGKRIVIGGATGYLGRHLVKAARGRGMRVRALARSEARLGDVRAFCDEVFVGEATRIETLAGLCDNADFVVSALGNRTFARKPNCLDVDYQGNMNILARAREAKVSRFLFVSVLRGEEARHRVPQIEARERVVDALRNGTLPWTILRPSGFFNDMVEILQMAKQGRVWLPGGNVAFNPIHGEDLAEVCMDVLGDPGTQGQEVLAGGPDTFTMKEVAELAFESIGKPVRISRISPWILNSLGQLLKPFNVNLASFILMLSVLAERDARCDAYGKQHLRDFFRELATTGEVSLRAKRR